MSQTMSENIPEKARDDQDLGWNERDDDRDEELRRDVPPHHGG